VQGGLECLNEVVRCADENGLLDHHRMGLGVTT
jgi:hypothetical protein